jgi:hypothetical protein
VVLYILQLLAEIFIFIIVIPTLFPEMCGSAWNFSIFLRPICVLSETRYPSQRKAP